MMFHWEDHYRDDAQKYQSVPSQGNNNNNEWEEEMWAKQRMHMQAPPQLVGNMTPAPVNYGSNSLPHFPNYSGYSDNGMKTIFYDETSDYIHQRNQNTIPHHMHTPYNLSKPITNNDYYKYYVQSNETKSPYQMPLSPNDLINNQPVMSLPQKSASVSGISPSSPAQDSGTYLSKQPAFQNQHKKNTQKANNSLKVATPIRKQTPKKTPVYSSPGSVDSSQIKDVAARLTEVPGLETIRWESLLESNRKQEVGDREVEVRVREAETLGARLFGGDLEKLLSSLLSQHLDFLVYFVRTSLSGDQKHQKLVRDLMYRALNSVREAEGEHSD